MNLFSKPLNEITKQDLELFIKEGYPEDLHLEIKRDLSGGSWSKSQKNISDKSKNRLVKEIVAFANSDGGILLVGIGETEDKPHRPEGIYPIEEVAELAERIRRSMHNTIEPRIPNLKVVGIPTDGKSGVLIAKVEKSYQAPHRADYNKECYIRRNADSTSMTMREIKDLTLRSVDTYENLQKRLKKRSKKFKDDFEARNIPFKYNLDEDRRIGMRISLLPIVDQVLFPNIYKKANRKDSVTRLRLLLGEDNKTIDTPFDVNNDRPILRGVIFYGDYLNIRIMENGLLEYTLITSDKFYRDDSSLAFHGDWIIGYIYRALSLLEKIKKSYELFDNEYVVDVELLSNVDKFFTQPVGWSNRKVEALVNESNLRFPQYTYKGNDIEDLLNLVNDDLFNICGHSNSRKFEIVKS
ncbi:ATP-binding protein [Aliifodinibius sp. S!AR15-10]|uniref:AlbA family DNA-binding domain-containing protein n=1 Tax=Aliifodinibius sp. S!AR15-10 TaxID=2950437 RepID=UPI00285FEBE9|nr:ATP-binding protein [Aliifodinibius sp. S!AR15-10]MDR8391908.1 ATP-binding protein [Aliifodinibius sp. S!AR15-10]